MDDGHAEGGKCIYKPCFYIVTFSADICTPVIRQPIIFSGEMHFLSLANRFLNFKFTMTVWHQA